MSKQFKLSKQTKQAMAFIMLVAIFTTVFMVVRLFPPPTSDGNGFGNGITLTTGKTVKLQVTLTVYTEISEDDNWYLPTDPISKTGYVTFDFTEDDRVAYYLAKNYTIEKIEVEKLKFYAEASGAYQDAYVEITICGKTRKFYAPTGNYYEITVQQTVSQTEITATVYVYVYAKAWHGFNVPKIVAKDFSLTATVYLTET